MRERFAPRVLEAEPASLLDEGGNLDPDRIWATMMKNEKPGGDGERSVRTPRPDRFAIRGSRGKVRERRS